MILIRLVYASRAAQGFNPSEITSILESAQRKNPALNITGLLFYGNNYFFQCLEGPRDQVNRLYNKLMQDKRHEDVQILELKEVSQRFFDGWSMKFVALSAIEQKIIRETGLKSFNPYALTSRNVESLLNAFSQHRQTEAMEAVLNSRQKKARSSLFSWFRPRTRAVS